VTAGVRAFKTLTFLAPAVRVDTFKTKLLPVIKAEPSPVEAFSVFTMRKDLEKADNCIGVYRKSLLYLVSLAFEHGGKSPILGLEESIRKDKDLVALFGLSGSAAKRGDVIWSTTGVASGLNASMSKHHGDFDDDPATMNSVLRRVRALGDADPIVEFVPSNRPKDWPFIDAAVGRDTEEPLFAQLLNLAKQQATTGALAVASSPLTAPAMPVGPSGLPAVGSGPRRALCVGIDRYPRSPLAGCVNDTRDWIGTFRAMRFEDVRTVFDEEATADRITAELRSLIASAKPGDVLVWQYAGHGTQVPDVDGDESRAGREGDGRDEAIVPVDFDEGHFIIDDDIQEIFAAIPEGVLLVCFFDCCHSGEMSRFGAAPLARSNGVGHDVRMRFLPISETIAREYVAQRKKNGNGNGNGSRAILRTRAVDDIRAVSFSACQSHEVAFESDGHGAFTAIATRILRSGATGVTNEAFLTQVRTAFGAGARQTPQMLCPVTARELGLLQPLRALV
jgi:hypothetical protein